MRAAAGVIDRSSCERQRPVTRSGQSERHDSIAPIKTPKSQSRIRGQVRILNTQQRVTPELEHRVVMFHRRLYFFLYNFLASLQIVAWPGLNKFIVFLLSRTNGH